MAEPFTQVPQGQVGTGTAYVHQYRDNSAAIQALAEAKRQQRIDREKKLASLKDFNYGEVVDQTMANEIRNDYKEGLDFFAQVFVNGGDPTNLSTEEGSMFSEFKQKIQDKAKQANSADARYKKYYDIIANDKSQNYDQDVWTALSEKYENAKTVDDKIDAVSSLDPITFTNFDYTKWIDDAVEDVAKDVLIKKQTKDKTQYEQDYADKLKGIALELAGTNEYDVAEVKWEKKKAEGDPAFQQPDFATFLNERINAEGERRLKEYESSRNPININQRVSLPGQTTAGGGTVSTVNTGAVQSLVWLYNEPGKVVLTRRSDGKIEGKATTKDLKEIQGGNDTDLKVFTFEGENVVVDPVQYAKNFHYQLGKEYVVGDDPKYKTLDINLRNYYNSNTQKTAKLSTVFYDQGANMWGQSKEGGYFLLAPRDTHSPLWENPLAELNAKTILTTFFGMKDVEGKTKEEIFRLIKEKFPLF